MFVENLLPLAREKLVILAETEPLIAAAKLLQAGTDIVVLNDIAGTLAGIITKTDIVARISICAGNGCCAPATSAMTRAVVTCRPEDWLSRTWQTMKVRGLKNIPIIDAEQHPLGMLTARDALEALKQEVESEEALLRDYVMCVGYQ